MTTFIRALENNHKHVFYYFGETSKEIIQLAARYTLADVTFNGLVLQNKVDQLNQDVKNTFEKFTISSLYKVDSKLATQFILNEDSKAIEGYFGQNYQWLLSAGFKSSYTTLAAALYVNDKEHCQRAFAFYREMKKVQPILTGRNDIPIAVYLTKNEEADVKQMAITMATYYKELKSAFAQGDALQTLSQILISQSHKYDSLLKDRVIQLKQMLEQQKIKVTKMNYPFIGILALNAFDKSTLEKLITLYNELNEVKFLKRNKELALQISIQKTIVYLQKEVNVSTTDYVSKLDSLLEIADILANLPIGITEFSLGNFPFFD